MSGSVKNLSYYCDMWQITWHLWQLVSKNQDAFILILNQELIKILITTLFSILTLTAFLVHLKGLWTQGDICIYHFQSFQSKSLFLCTDETLVLLRTPQFFRERPLKQLILASHQIQDKTKSMTESAQFLISPFV